MQIVASGKLQSCSICTSGAQTVTLPQLHLEHLKKVSIAFFQQSSQAVRRNACMRMQFRAVQCCLPVWTGCTQHQHVFAHTCKASGSQMLISIVCIPKIQYITHDNQLGLVLVSKATTCTQLDVNVLQECFKTLF